MENLQYSVKVTVEFAAAHHIRGYDGECARPHGHNWVIEVEATTPKINEIGIAVDFKVLKSMVKKLIDRYDHQDLNSVAPFNDKMNPTAESLSFVLYKDLEHMILASEPMANLKLKRITVWENARCSASFGLV